MDTSNEPVLATDEIQGDILSGFKKDAETLVFLRLPSGELTHAKRWLREVEISSLRRVQAFNVRFSRILKTLARDPPDMCATWVNIAFTARALARLTSPAEVASFTDRAFKQGMSTDALALGDWTSANDAGHPSRWRYGGPGNETDIVLLVASDSQDELEVRVEALLRAALGAGLDLVYREEGRTLPPPLTGHEHFGFRDGVSQPSVRGRLSESPEDLLTPRWMDPAEAAHQDPVEPELSRPGQPLVWPGQFVFGYPRQSPNDRRVPIAAAVPGPAWAKDGSFLVIRRLRQDVAGFRQYLAEEVDRLRQAGMPGLSVDLIGALMVGRWKSGAPVMRAALEDDPALAANLSANNHFHYQEATQPRRLSSSAPLPRDTFPQAPGDLFGDICPYAAHIRKVNPRDFNTEQGGAADTLTRLVLRRGIPFGPLLPEGATADPAHGERGLLFICYQASIEAQFQFLMKLWANDTRAPSGGGGEDPIIGQASAPPGTRRFAFTPKGGAPVELELPTRFVLPTGGGYFFMPSLSALRDVLGK